MAYKVHLWGLEVILEESQKNIFPIKRALRPKLGPWEYNKIGRPLEIFLWCFSEWENAFENGPFALTGPNFLDFFLSRFLKFSSTETKWYTYLFLSQIALSQKIISLCLSLRKFEGKREISFQKIWATVKDCKGINQLMLMHLFF